MPVIPQRTNPSGVKSALLLLGLLLAVCLSFWLSPAPLGQPEVEYWGHYARVGPGLGFVVNHDSYGYLAVAQQPGKLLLPQEVRQSRPLYALLGAVVGYPLTGALRLAGRVGIAPLWGVADAEFYGFYSGFVLLNGLVLLASLLLLRWLWQAVAASRGEAWQFYAVAWVLVANPITKAFFWTAHQQMFAFFVPLFCLTLAVQLRQRAHLGWGPLAALSLGLGLLPLVYGSFVLVWPALVIGWWQPGMRWLASWGMLALTALLFVLPTLGWIAILKLNGIFYYNHEAERFHQLVWLLEARQLPAPEFFRLVGSKLAEYAASLRGMSGWLLLGAAFYAATRWRNRSDTGLMPPILGRALAWVAVCFVLFYAFLGYYPERLTYTLLPLVLCLLAALLPYWPRRFARPAAFALAVSWHLYVLLSYGPFS